jgi:HAE1 family hydrophobic/amphiphilic exporter-1
MGTLSDLAQQVKDKVSDIPGYTNVDVSAEEATPELQWTVDRDKALQLGVNFTDVANTINAATNGSIASYYHESGFQYPIIVEIPPGQRRTLEAMKDLVVVPAGSSSTGEPILLRQVAHPTFALGPSEIDRQDRQRFVTVTGSPEGRTTGEIQADVTKQLAGMKFPQGYHWDWGVRQQERDQEFAGMGLAVILAIGLIYMLLASQFESFVHPLTIVLSVPLCASGVLLALFLTNRAFGLTALIGILMLVGIVVKNGILLVDYTNLLRSRGVSRDEAVLSAGPTRLRPILMTASATVLGMLPLAIGLGEGSETQAPMATAVCGGLITSTILTLFVVPTVYTLFDDIGRKLRGDNRDLAAPELVTPSVEAVEASQV